MQNSCMFYTNFYCKISKGILVSKKQGNKPLFFLCSKNRERTENTLFFNTQVAKRSVLVEEKLESFLDNSEVIMHE